MDFQKLLNEWSMQTPQVVTLGTTSLYYLGLFAEFLAAEQLRAADEATASDFEKLRLHHNERCSCGNLY